MTEDEQFEADKKYRIAALHKTAPETIWLQIDPEAKQFDGWDAQTWCEDNINDTDLEYIRADLVEALRQQLAAITAERDDMKAEAHRYQWLRTHGLQRAWVSLGTDCDGQNFADFKCEFKVPEPPNLPYEDDEGLEWADKDFDAAIDAAIAAKDKWK